MSRELSLQRATSWRAPYRSGSPKGTEFSWMLDASQGRTLPFVFPGLPRRVALSGWIRRARQSLYDQRRIITWAASRWTLLDERPLTAFGLAGKSHPTDSTEPIRSPTTP